MRACVKRARLLSLCRLPIPIVSDRLTSADIRRNTSDGKLLGWIIARLIRFPKSYPRT